jgi:hydroxyacylglutathione hydrolase
VVFLQVCKACGTLWYPEDTGHIADRVYAVRIKDINLFLYANGQQTLAFDAAYAGDTLQDVLNRLSIAHKSVPHLFLTHTDMDHARRLALVPNAHLYLSEDEEQMVDGTMPRLLRVVHNARIKRPYTWLTAAW